jgi:hypothetical protein
MSSDEAKTFCISKAERRLYVRLDSAEVNIFPPAAEAKWVKLAGVPLRNRDDLYPHAPGCKRAWQHP